MKEIIMQPIGYVRNNVENNRKQGNGKKLMSFVKKYFRDKAKEFILVTDKSNETAKKFYEANGWKTGEYDFYTFFYS